MLRKQRGVTALGWVVLLIPVAIVVYAGLRLVPVYLNFTKVARSMSQTADGLKGEENLTPTVIRNALEKRFDIESIDYPALKDVAILRSEGHWSLEANYEDLAPLFSNVYLLVRFDKTVLIGS
ncbi:MAG: DUF4845 domain-containing protein [Steroidobacteraceae bacterium]